jgi:hypothetical protein
MGAEHIPFQDVNAAESGSIGLPPSPGRRAEHAKITIDRTRLPKTERPVPPSTPPRPLAPPVKRQPA